MRDQPVDEAGDRVARIVAAVPGEEGLLGGGQLVPRRRRQPEVGEVEAVPVGEDVPEVGVEVEHARRVHERDVAPQRVVHHRDRRLSCRLVAPDVLLHPGLEPERDVLEEDGDGGRRPGDRLDAPAHRRRTVPVRDGRLHVGELVGQRQMAVVQHPPVVEEREGGGATGQHPARRCDERGQFAPHAERRRPDAVLAAEGQVEEVGGRHHVLGPALEVGEWDLLDEDRRAVHVDDRRRAADARADDGRAVQQVAQAPVAEQR